MSPVPWNLLTGAAEEAVRYRREEEEARRQERLRRIPTPVSPEQTEYWKGQTAIGTREADIAQQQADIRKQQQTQEEITSDYKNWSNTFNPEDGQYYKGQEILGHFYKAKLLKTVAPVFKEGGALVGGGAGVAGVAPEQSAQLKAIEEYINSKDTPADRKKLMGTLGLAEGVPKIEPKITPTTALSILSDPFKAMQLKRQYPEYFNMVVKIAEDAFGKGITGKVAPESGQPTENSLMDTNW